MSTRRVSITPLSRGSTADDRDGNGKSLPRGVVHPAWIALIKLCQDIGFGEIERLKIQDGVPVMAERAVQRVKLT